MGKKVVIEIGKTYGAYTVLAYHGVDPHGQRCWWCRCRCGIEKIVVRRTILRRVTGCRLCFPRPTITHGGAHSTEYSTWRSLKSRCFNTNAKGYKNYGTRGITVCARWLDADNGFANFLSDMGLKPSKRHSINRINNDEGYYPSNCEWADDAKQSRNKRTNIFLTIDGVRKIAADWAVDTGQRPGRLYDRIYRGWADDKEIVYGRNKTNKIKRKFLVINNIKQTPAEWAKQTNQPSSTLYHRLYRGWSDEEIVYGKNETNKPAKHK